MKYIQKVLRVSSDESDDSEEEGEKTKRIKVKTKESLNAKRAALMRAKEDKEVQLLHEFLKTHYHQCFVQSAKKQKVSTDDQANYLGDEDGEEFSGGGFKELMIRIEKRLERMEKQQDCMDRKLEKIIVNLESSTFTAPPACPHPLPPAPSFMMMISL